MKGDVVQKQKCTNLDFLNQLTKRKPKMVLEMIKVYLEETPRLVNNMKQGIAKADWELVARTAHAMIPSFSTMGINRDFAAMAKKIQEYAEKKENPEAIQELSRKIETVCEQAFEELEQEKVLLENMSQP